MGALVSLAVERYLKIKKLEERIEKLQEELGAYLVQMDEEEFQEYVRRTEVS